MLPFPFYPPPQWPTPPSSPSPPGRWPHNAAHPLDAAREHHVQEVHHRKRCLEPGRRAVGDLHVRQAALVSAVQQRGAQWAGRAPRGLMSRGVPWREARGQMKSCGFVGRSTSHMASLYLNVMAKVESLSECKSSRERKAVFADTPGTPWEGAEEPLCAAHLVNS